MLDLVFLYRLKICYGECRNRFDISYKGIYFLKPIDFSLKMFNKYELTYKVLENKNTVETDKKSQEILDSIDNNLKQDLNIILQKAGISIAAFVDGANKAFEVIIESFAKADTKVLKPLLSEKILQQFKLAIKDRQNKDQFLNTKIVAIDESKIIATKMVKSYVTITVKFISRQINYITDKEGKVLQGSQEEVNNVNDVWTFKKDSKSKNPNWFVSATTS